MIVWLASYPRSGNTFFRVILNSIFDIKTYSIYDDRGDIGADEKTSDIVGHEFLPQDFNIQQARESDEVFYIKTHELLDKRVQDEDKTIYLIRDGRESSLSYTKHRNIYSEVSVRLKDIIYGNTFVSSWGEHVASWNPKNRNNTLLIKFEKLIKDPSEFITQISHFLEKEPVNGTIPTFEELKKINPKFFRSGKTNSWEDIYTEEEHLAFWMTHSLQMITYGYDYKIPKVISENANINLFLELTNQNTYIMKLLLENKQLQNNENIIKEKNRQLSEMNKQLQGKELYIQTQAKDKQALQLKLEEKENFIREKNKQLQEKELHIQTQAKDKQALQLKLEEKELHIQIQTRDKQALLVQQKVIEEFINTNGIVHPLRKKNILNSLRNIISNTKEVE
jgi:hypothetical protein